LEEKETLEFEFNIVDVFAEKKFGGNQLAVFRNAHSLDVSEMQKIAKEMNYSETTFVLSDEKRNEGYDVRIFTPQTELPFAGHPTLGTAYVIQEEIIKDKMREIKLNLKIGQIPVTLDFENDQVDTLWMKQNPPIFGNQYGADKISEILGLDIDDMEESYPICEVSTGFFCFVVPVKTLAAYLVKYRYFGTEKIDVRVEQGYELGRPSLLLLESEEKAGIINVRVGGRVFMVASGRLFL